MSLKEDINKEKSELVANKKPYETAAFIIFSIMFIQQMFFLVLRFLAYFKAVRDMKDAVALGATPWDPSFSLANVTNVPGFVVRILNVDSTKVFYIILMLLGLALWYYLHYLFIWNYCKKRGHAKWTWTVLVMFGPTLLFMPAYIFYAVYVFRPYFFRFIKTVVEEYKAYDPKIPFKEEIETEVVEVKKVEKKEKVKKEEPKKEENKDAGTMTE